MRLENSFKNKVHLSICTITKIGYLFPTYFLRGVPGKSYHIFIEIVSSLRKKVQRHRKQCKDSSYHTFNKLI